MLIKGCFCPQHTSRSVWIAPCLLARFPRLTRSKAGASSNALQTLARFLSFLSLFLSQASDQRYTKNEMHLVESFRMCEFSARRFSTMITTLPLKNMTKAQKLLAMEELWVDLSRDQEKFNSPAWHFEGLAQTEKDIRAGKIKFMDWGQAKKSLRDEAADFGCRMGGFRSGRQFYENQSSGVGTYFLNSLFSDIDALVVSAGMHRMVGGYHRIISRRFPFAIYYNMEGEHVRVRRILDCRRSPSWVHAQLKQG
jgi:hypothetical protein